MLEDVGGLGLRYCGLSAKEHGSYKSIVTLNPKPRIQVLKFRVYSPGF